MSKRSIKALNFFVSDLQKHTKIFDSELNSVPMTVYDCNYNLQDLQCTENVQPNAEQWCEASENDDVPISTISSPNLISGDPQCVENVPNDEQGRDNKDIITRNVNISANNTAASSSSLSFEQKSENFQRFVIQKLINLELKMNRIETNQKLILQKLSTTTSVGTFETEEEEKIDIFQDLSLRDENDLQAMEIKLKNDSFYRNQMIKQLAHIRCDNLKTSFLRLMKIMISNELAIKYSWYGAKKKEIFSKLDVCKIIMSVIRKFHADATDKQISAPIKIWLAHAKERMERHRNTN
ncbi:unnamed protein product [Lasius platythorax]|uniref:DUF4806 domain-containing protein n=1 Tax=Lasius platythorax TaxID=488582 RepID=A0AAV2P219_9HYME